EPPVEKKEPAADVADLDAVVEAAIKDAAAAGVSEKPPVAAPPAKEPEELEEVIEEPPPPPAEVEEVAAAPPVEEVAPPVEEVAPPVEEVAPPVEEPPPPEEEKEEAVVDDVVAELLEAAEAPPVEKVAVEPPPPAEAPPAEVAVPVDDIVAELLEEAQKPPAEAPPPPPERVPAEVPPERAPAEIPPAVPPMEAAVPPAGALPPPVAVQPKKVQIPRDSREAAIFFAKGEEALLRKAYEQHAEQTLVEAQKALETRKLVDAIMRRLRFSSEKMDTVAHCIRDHMRFMSVPNMKRSTLRRMVGAPTFPVELELHRVDCIASHGDMSNYDLLVKFQRDMADEPVLPDPWVTGADLIEMGLQEGPAVGARKKKAYEAQLEGKFTDRESLLEWVREQLR
ncbi:hypothetical protein ACFLQU_03675, partial [Verrucomicrobiota bacterium]